MVRGGTGVKIPVYGLNFLPAPKAERLGVYYQLVRCGAKKEEERVRLKSYKQSNIKKWSLTLLHLFTRIKLERKEESDVCLLRDRSVY